MTNDELERTTSNTIDVKTKKLPKRGIIYLSSIPPYMNVTKIRDIFGEFGTIGRVYLQLAYAEQKPGEKKSKRKIAKKFTEGWVEFERKSIAKKVATSLNNKQVSNRKKSKHYDVIWNIKYLSNFKWTHLHERLAYEKAARRQKLRAEIQLAKQKNNFFAMNLDKHKKKKMVANKDVPVSGNVAVADTEVSSPKEDRKVFLESLFIK